MSYGWIENIFYIYTEYLSTPHFFPPFITGNIRSKIGLKTPRKSGAQGTTYLSFSGRNNKCTGKIFQQRYLLEKNLQESAKGEK